ncbi:MAG TPA: 5-formyltetrahydrofolate cyclo-ligase [Holophagaceae bacterium]|nr:5-formyltetrahydrofolate cyclo-ligase [Holophagaceae bacterium]
MDSKPDLRARMAALRAALGDEARAAANARICEGLIHLCESRRWRRIGAFWPYRSEVDLRAAIAARTDWTWYFPKVTSTAPPRLAWGSEPLEPGLWGLMEPTFAQHFLPPVDLLLVPGLAFDPQGYRLGYGGGYYDALLGRLREELPTLGVGFSLQQVPALPLDPQDLPVDGLLTERGLEWFNQESPLDR